MTNGEACKLLGYAVLPLLDRESRQIVIKTVIRLSESGSKAISPQMANLCRDQIDEFG